MKNRLSIKLCQKNIFTEKKYDELEKYSSISYVREGQDASSLACAAGAKILKIIKQNEIASFLNFNVIDLKVKQIINGKIQFRSKSSFFQIQV